MLPTRPQTPSLSEAEHHAIATVSAVLLRAHGVVGGVVKIGREAQHLVLRCAAQVAGVEADVIEDAFLEANPDLAPDGVVVTCRSGMVQEVRICLTKDLEFRDCGGDVGRVCRGVAAMEAVR